MLLEVGMFVAGVLTGAGAVSWTNVWLNKREAVSAKAKKKASAKAAAEKRRSKAISKVREDMVKVSQQSMLREGPAFPPGSTEPADPSLYGGRKNGEATWGG